MKKTGNKWSTSECGRWRRNFNHEWFETQISFNGYFI